MARMPTPDQPHNSTRRSPRPLKARIASTVVSSILALVLAECLVRVFVPEAPSLRFLQTVDESTVVTNAQTTREVFRNDNDLFWRLRRNVQLDYDGTFFSGLISNSQGLREEHAVDIPKPAGTVRILFLGDSSTFGVYLQHTQTFVHKTEQQLQQQFPDESFECINAGVPAYSLFQGWRFFETSGVRYEPDLVIASFGVNGEGLWDQAGDIDHYKSLQARQPQAGLRWSRLARLAWGSLHSPPQAKDGEKTRRRLLPDEFAKLLAKLHESVRARGAELLLLIPPHRINFENYRSFRDFPKTFLQAEQYRFGNQWRFGPENTASFIDGPRIALSLAGKRPVSEILLDSVHPTELTNTRLAQAICLKIQPWLKVRLEEVSMTGTENSTPRP